MIEKIFVTLAASKVIEGVVLLVFFDTLFGVIRAIKEHSLNSSIGIDGAIRKISMLISLVGLKIADMIIGFNFVGFVPKDIRAFLSLEFVGTAEFFGLLYCGYEIVSVLKNMTLCGLPVKGLWKMVRKLLSKYTKELPDTEEKDAQQEGIIATVTDDVPEGALEDNEDGNVKVYDEEGNVVGSISKEVAESLAAAVTEIRTE